MIQINLLPIRKQLKKERSKHFVITYLLSILLAVTAMGYLWNSQRTTFDQLNKRHGALSQELERYASFDQRLKKLKQEKELIDEKRRIIGSLCKDRDKLARSLALFSFYTPAEKLWFDKFSNTEGRVNISGVAISNEAVAEFLRNLETSPFIAKGSVILAHSRQKSVGQQRLREFQISCVVLPYSAVHDPAQPPETPAKKPADKV